MVERIATQGFTAGTWADCPKTCHSSQKVRINSGLNAKYTVFSDSLWDDPFVSVPLFFLHQGSDRASDNRFIRDWIVCCAYNDETSSDRASDNRFIRDWIVCCTYNDETSSDRASDNRFIRDCIPPACQVMKICYMQKRQKTIIKA